MGLLRVLRNAATTLRRLSARTFFWPLPERMVSRSDSRLGVEVEALQQPLERLGAHAAGEVLPEAVAQLAVERLVGDELLDLELAEGVETSSSRSSSRWARSRSWRSSRSAPSRTLRRTSPLAPSASSAAMSSSSFFWRASTSASRLPSIRLRLDAASAPRASAGRGGAPRRRPRDQVGREVDDLLEVLGRQVEQVAQARRDALEVPDVRDRGGRARCGPSAHGAPWRGSPRRRSARR